jgi:pre-rRNA-processing protein TSR2
MAQSQEELLRQRDAIMAQQRCRCNPTQFAAFVQGMDAVLLQWTALLLVNKHHDGTAAEDLRNRLVETFTEYGELFVDELQGFFEDFFEENRFVMVEDGSEAEAAGILNSMYKQCAQNDFSPVQGWMNSLAVYQQQNPVEHSALAAASGAAPPKPEWAEGETPVTLEGDEEAEEAASDEEQPAQQPAGFGFPTATTSGSPFAFGTTAVIPASPFAPPPPPPAPAVDKPKTKPKKKNDFVKGNDGWCTIVSNKRK